MLRLVRVEPGSVKAYKASSDNTLVVGHVHWTYDGRFAEVAEGWTFNNVVWHGRFSFRTTVAVLMRTETGIFIGVTIADLGRLRMTELDSIPG